MFELNPKHKYQSNVDRSVLQSAALYKKHRKGASQQQKYKSKVWKAAQTFFGFPTDSIMGHRSYLLVVSENIADIAKDDLLGQSTSGHSCKNSSSTFLAEILQDSGIQIL